jgi:clan AA aspartic protease
MTGSHDRSDRPLIGAVDGRGSASVELRVASPAGQATVSCVVDTGFTGALVLPAATVRRLGLRRTGVNSATLADGSRIVLSRYAAQVDWLSGPRQVLLYSTPGVTALIGTRLLSEHRLVIDYPKRTVEIGASEQS